MYLTVDSLIAINCITTDSINITLRKVSVKPYGYDKMYMDKDLIEDIVYESTNSMKKKINPSDLYYALFGNMYPFYDGNGRNCKIPFVNNFI